jgi:hypothetical protein
MFRFFWLFRFNQKRAEKKELMGREGEVKEKGGRRGKGNGREKGRGK